MTHKYTSVPTPLLFYSLPLSTLRFSFCILYVFLCLSFYLLSEYRLAAQFVGVVNKLHFFVITRIIYFPLKPSPLSAGCHDNKARASKHAVSRRPACKSSSFLNILVIFCSLFLSHCVIRSTFPVLNSCVFKLLRSLSIFHSLGKIVLVPLVLA